MTQRKHRGHRPVASMTLSDFENDTDHPYLSSSPPPPPERTDNELNLAVLTRHYPEIVSIHHVSPYAVVYIFSQAEEAWEKCGIEGSSFLVKLAATRRNPVRYAVVVLNRRGLDNFFLELQTPDKVEITNEYIILQGEMAGQPCIYGLWVFAEPEPSSTANQREDTAKKIVSCAEQVEASTNDNFSSGYDGELDEGSVELEGDDIGAGAGGEGSLSAMLGQQRRADDAWTVHTHSPNPQPTPQGPNFTTFADTDFFLSAKHPGTSPSPAVSAQGSATGNAQKDNLLSLFQVAKEKYQGT